MQNIKRIDVEAGLFELMQTTGATLGEISRCASRLKRHKDMIGVPDKPGIERDDDFLSSFTALQEWAYRIARMKGFHDKPRDRGMALALVHSEVSEALEAIRKSPDKDSEHIPEFSAIEEELADIIIRVLDFAEEYDSHSPGSGGNGLRVCEAIFAKIAYNATRPRMHGGKNC